MAPVAHHTQSIRLLWPFIRLLSKLSIHLPMSDNGVELEPAVLQDPNGRIPHADAMALLEHAMQLTGDPALGLRAAECIHPGDFDALEFVVRASSTLREALEATTRFIALLDDAIHVTPETRGEREHWCVRFRAPTPTAAVEFALASLVLVGRTLHGRPSRLSAVTFRAPEPAHADEHRKLFACDVQWGQRDDALVFETNRLDLPLSSARCTIKHALEEHAERLLAELPSQRTHAVRVREKIIATLRRGPASLDVISAHLGISERTLRRRVREEGVSFSDLIADVRRELALQYLRDPNLSVMEIAFLLGFMDASAFQKAFRRWFARAPSEFRQARHA